MAPLVTINYLNTFLIYSPFARYAICWESLGKESEFSAITLLCCLRAMRVIIDTASNGLCGIWAHIWARDSGSPDPCKERIGNQKYTVFIPHTCKRDFSWSLQVSFVPSENDWHRFWFFGPLKLKPHLICFLKAPPVRNWVHQ